MKNHRKYESNTSDYEQYMKIHKLSTIVITTNVNWAIFSLSIFGIFNIDKMKNKHELRHKDFVFMQFLF